VFPSSSTAQRRTRASSARSRHCVRFSRPGRLLRHPSLESGPGAGRTNHHIDVVFTQMLRATSRRARRGTSSEQHAHVGLHELFERHHREQERHEGSERDEHQLNHAFERWARPSWCVRLRRRWSDRRATECRRCRPALARCGPGAIGSPPPQLPPARACVPEARSRPARRAPERRSELAGNVAARRSATSANRRRWRPPNSPMSWRT